MLDVNDDVIGDIITGDDYYGGVGDGDGEADEFSDFRGRQSDHNSPRAPPQLSFSFHPGGCRGLPPSAVENGPLKRRNECGIV